MVRVKGLKTLRWCINLQFHEKFLHSKVYVLSFYNFQKVFGGSKYYNSHFFCSSPKMIVAFSKFNFSTGAKILDLFLVWPKKFGPAQNILGPVEGQGIRLKYNAFYPEKSCVCYAKNGRSSNIYLFTFCEGGPFL